MSEEKKPAEIGWTVVCGRRAESAATIDVAPHVINVFQTWNALRVMRKEPLLVSAKFELTLMPEAQGFIIFGNSANDLQATKTMLNELMHVLRNTIAPSFVYAFVQGEMLQGGVRREPGPQIISLARH